MQRFIIEKLNKWKNLKNRKPLILKGARQVGKTWIMKEFGKNNFKNYVYFNFDENLDLQQLFETNKSALRLIERLSLISGIKIEPNKTLIIFDEIQECSEALNSLKYFCEDASEYAVICAGSLLGTKLSEPKSYPVGKVDILNVYPLDFEEFLLATDEKLFEVYKTFNKQNIPESIFNSKLKEVYQNYLIIGGLPECVNSWIKEKDPKRIDEIQDSLIELYENDITKHSNKVNAGRILMIYRNIVPQLSKETKKFIYSKIEKGARAREFEEAIEWVVSAGLINRVYLSSNNIYPLKAYDELNAFKLYFFDTGLLRRMAGVSNESILFNKEFAFKGAITENYVLQQIKGLFDIEPNYFTFDGRYEIDFLAQINDEIVPIEVKSGSDVESVSLKNYIKRYSPKYSIRYSALNYMNNDNIKNIPLYLIRKTKDLI